MKPLFGIPAETECNRQETANGLLETTQRHTQSLLTLMLASRHWFAGVTEGLPTIHIAGEETVTKSGHLWR
jgi:hypothetical protein